MTPATPAAETLRNLAKCTHHLYSLPTVAIQVLQLTNHPRVDVAALKKCIENDPALTAKLLRVTNSSLFGLSRQVTDLGQALALLGTKPLKLLVLGFSLPKELFVGIEATVLTHYWRYALVKSIAARDISRRYWPAAGDDAFTAALLQDVGLLALIQILGTPYLHLVQQAFETGCHLPELESATLGFQHRALSAQMLGGWGLPDALVQVVASAPDPELLAALPRGQREVAEAVHLADLVAQLLTQHRPAALAQLLDDGARLCDLTIEQLEAPIAKMSNKVSELCDVLALELPDQDYADLLVEAQHRMTSVVEQMWSDGGTNHNGEDVLLENSVAIQASLKHALQTKLGDSGFESSQHPMSTSAAAAAADRSSRSAASLHGRSTTQVASDPGLVGRVEAAINSCRRAHCPLSLVLVELDAFEQLVLHYSLAGAQRQVHRLETTIAELCEGHYRRFPVGDSRIAVIMPDCDRQQAVQFARQLVGSVSQWVDDGPAPGPALSISSGVATLSVPPKNSPTRELIEATERCLSAAQLSGGNGVKSIDVF